MKFEPTTNSVQPPLQRLTRCQYVADNHSSAKVRNIHRIMPIVLLPIVLLVTILLAGTNRAQAAPLGQVADSDVNAEITTLMLSAPTFYDDFSTWDEQWTLGSDGGMTNHDGSLQTVAVQGLGNNFGWITHAALADLDLTDYFFEATVARPGDPALEFSAGLLFRYQDAENFYLFLLRQLDGQSGYILLSMEGGEQRCTGGAAACVDRSHSTICSA